MWCCGTSAQSYNLPFGRWDRVMLLRHGPTGPLVHPRPQWLTSETISSLKWATCTISRTQKTLSRNDPHRPPPKKMRQMEEKLNKLRKWEQNGSSKKWKQTFIFKTREIMPYLTFQMRSLPNWSHPKLPKHQKIDHWITEQSAKIIFIAP